MDGWSGNCMLGVTGLLRGVDQPEVPGLERSRELALELYSVLIMLGGGMRMGSRSAPLLV